MKGVEEKKVEERERERRMSRNQRGGRGKKWEGGEKRGYDREMRNEN